VADQGVQQEAPGPPRPGDDPAMPDIGGQGAAPGALLGQGDGAGVLLAPGPPVDRRQLLVWLGEKPSSSRSSQRNRAAARTAEGSSSVS
jgi:hypothetical protein